MDMNGKLIVGETLLSEIAIPLENMVSAIVLSHIDDDILANALESVSLSSEDIRVNIGANERKLSALVSLQNVSVDNIVSHQV